MRNNVEDAVDNLLDVVADNLRRAMEAHTKLARKTDKPSALAAMTGLGKGTINRILRGSRGSKSEKKSAAKIDTLMRIAWELKCPVWQFLVAHDTMARVFDAEFVRKAEKTEQEEPSKDLKASDVDHLLTDGEFPCDR